MEMIYEREIRKMMWYKKLLLENVTEKEKYVLLLKTIKYLRKVEDDASYKDMIQEIFLLIEKNIENFEKKIFSNNEIYEYIQKYERFWVEYLKYQIWLVGNVKDCEEVRKLLNYDKVHLLGEVRGADIKRQ